MLEIDPSMWNLIGEFSREQNDPESSLRRAVLNKSNNNFKQAILDFNHYIKFHPELPLPYLNLADCHYFLDNNNAAIENYEIGISKMQGNIPEGHLYNYGGALMAVTKYEEAMTIANLILKQDNNYLYGNLLKGHLLWILDKYDQSFYYLTKSIEIDSKLWMGWAIRSKIDYALRDFNRAHNDFTNAHLLNPDLETHFYTTHAFALYELGKIDEAIKEFERAKLLGDPEAQRFYDKLTSK